MINEQIRVITKEIDTLFKEQLDPTMIQFKSTAFDFFTGYTSARVIAHLRGKTTEPDPGTIEASDPPVDDGDQ